MSARATEYGRSVAARRMAMGISRTRLGELVRDRMGVTWACPRASIQTIEDGRWRPSQRWRDAIDEVLSPADRQRSEAVDLARKLSAKLREAHTPERIAEVLLTRPAVWEQVRRLMAVATEPLVAPVVTPDDIERAKRYAGPVRLGTAPSLDNSVHWQVGDSYYVTLRIDPATWVYEADKFGIIAEVLGGCQDELAGPVDHDDALRRVLARYRDAELEELRRQSDAFVASLAPLVPLAAGEFSAGACHELRGGADPCDGCGNTDTYETEADGYLVLLCTCGIARSVRPLGASSPAVDYRALAASTWLRGEDSKAEVLDTLADLLDGTLAANLRGYGLEDAAALVERLTGGAQ